MAKRFDMNELDKVPSEAWEKAGITKEDFIKMQTARQEREKKAPAVGSSAPDFKVKQISAKGKLLDEAIELSLLRWKPVALIFGSYT